MIKDRALHLSKDDSFRASNGWYEGFVKQFNLRSINLHGEGAEVDKNDPILLEELEMFYSIVRSYPPERVYNMDETGLFYKVTPRFTVITDEEDPSTVRGIKSSKDGVTIGLCSNATGDHKISPFMIGTAKEPACIRGNKWPLQYTSQ